MSTLKEWSECPIRHLPTEVLHSLKNQFGMEIERRRKTEKVVLILDKSSKPKTMRNVDRGDMEKANSADILALPYKNSLNMRMGYLKALLLQDWSKSFLGDFDQSPRYYVYAHVTPGSPNFLVSDECGGNFGGMPFYIGKGCGSRAYDLKRNQAHGQYIANAIKAGCNPDNIIKIIKEGLTEAQALELEAKYIYFFGSAYDEVPGPLVNLDRTMVPKFTGFMSKYTKLKKENKHWMAQWSRDHAHLIEGKS